MFLINGQRGEYISVHDRGLQYGDGIFTTMPILNHQPLCWNKHFDRLKRGCQRLSINFPSAGILESETRQLCIQNPKAVLKIIITRGASGRGYQPSADNIPSNRVVAIYPAVDYPPNYIEEGIDVHLCATRLARSACLAGLKHLNRLEQVIGRGEWNSPDIAEGLMLDTDDRVIEGTMSNIFAIFAHNRLLTPDVSHCGVAGIVRQSILELATVLGFQAEVTEMSLQQLYTAEEVFFCNSLIGIWPVRKIADRVFYLAPGLKTLRIREILRAQEIIA